MIEQQFVCGTSSRVARRAPAAGFALFDLGRDVAGVSARRVVGGRL